MLPIELVVGPERVPLLTEHRLTDAAVFGPFAYHGVIPSGLMQAAVADPRLRWQDADPRLRWQDAAPLLEDLLNGRVSDDGVAVVEGLEDWLAAARDAGVLSLRASTQVAQAMVLELAESSGPLGWTELCTRLRAPELARTAPTLATLWLVKEGHTSSVWQARWRAGDRELVACLNIARDREAARELLASATLLCAWHERSPDQVVDIVGSRDVVSQTTQGEVATALVVSSWVDGLELHAPQQSDRPARLAAVGWFVNEREPDTGFVRSQRIFGRWLDDGGEAAWRDLTQLLVSLAEPAPDGAWLLPDLRVNDGDLVWADGCVVLVAACEAPFVHRPGHAGPLHELAQWNRYAWDRLVAALAQRAPG
jgi:hypothetical protein